MLQVGQYEYIRTAHRVYGKGIRQIARETGHSRNTVRKALREQYSGYRERAIQPYPVLGPYLEVIDKWVAEDKDKPKKQRHSARRIYARLCGEYGFTGSERTVRRYVREAKLRLGIGGKEACIPLDPELGKEAEVDWGRCYAILAGNLTELKLFCMRSKGSGKHFVQCFPCERQQALFEGHIQAFGFFGGVFPVIIYDNLGTAVEKVLRGRERKLRESFLRFQAYYNFCPPYLAGRQGFCNPAQAHEKGGVEGLVGYARRNYMVPIPEADSLEELNRYLLEQCQGYGQHRIPGKDKTVNELYEQERRVLLELPEVAFVNVETYNGKVDKYCTVVVDRNRYSVPQRYVGLRVKAVAYVERVEIFYGKEKIAAHGRVYGKGKWQLNPFHYMDLLVRRPQAFDSARPIKQWRQRWPQALESLLSQFRDKLGHSKGTKEFVRVLMLFKDHGEGEVFEAVKEAVDAGVSCSDAVEQILANRERGGREAVEVSLRGWPVFPPPDVSVYEGIAWPAGRQGGGL